MAPALRHKIDEVTIKLLDQFSLRYGFNNESFKILVHLFNRDGDFSFLNWFFAFII